ncbi:MAG TPA: hypothetical protein VHN80_23260 [Kineosporiaceae bacterium]|nr:hypothetical protein [Kineosporiaceae bacterium]
MPRRQLDVDALVAAITQLTGDETLRTRAEALGTQVLAEDGVAAAVKAIRHLLQD